MKIGLLGAATVTGLDRQLRLAVHHPDQCNWILAVEARKHTVFIGCDFYQLGRRAMRIKILGPFWTASRIREVCSRCLFGDLLYAVLPLLVLGALFVTLPGRAFGEFLLLPEWSFAAIICFGVSIRELIELKVRRQRDFSFALDTNSQAYVFLLIASVFTLALIEIRESRGSHPFSVNENALRVLQLVLFVTAVGSLLISTAKKAKLEVERRSFPAELTDQQYVFHLQGRINTAQEQLGSGLLGARQYASRTKKLTGPPIPGREWVIQKICLSAAQVEEAAREIQVELGSRDAIHMVGEIVG